MAARPRSNRQDWLLVAIMWLTGFSVAALLGLVQ